MSLRAELAGRLPLAFGLSGPLASPLMRPAAARRLVEAAFKGGISMFDTAPAYGAGEGERRLGAALAGAGAEAFVMTKVGVVASGLARRRRDFSPDAVERSVEGSLARLGRPIDLLWMHGAAPDELTEALLARLAALRGDGRVGCVGLAGRGAEIEAGLPRGDFAAVMVPVHAGLAGARERVAQLKARGVAVFAIETMAPVGTRRQGLSAGTLWREGRALLRGRAGAGGLAFSPAEALAWSLAEGGADVAVVTTSRMDRLAANLETARQCTEKH